MRILLSAFSVVLAELIYAHCLGPPNCPLDVLVNLYCLLAVAFGVSFAICMAFGHKSMEPFTGMENAVFYYAFGAVIPITLLPAFSIYFEEYRYVLYLGAVFVLLATIWFNYFATPKKAKGESQWIV